MRLKWWSLLCTVHLVLGLNYKHDYRGFNDMNMYDIDWHGVDKEMSDFLAESAYETYQIASTRNEQYTCYIPPLQSIETTSPVKYTGPTPYELLMPLFAAGSCSIRIESYWTYEVCHGNHVRQYHEEREIKQEYHLGRLMKAHTESLMEAKQPAEASTSMPLPPHKKIEGSSLPYFEVEMTEGTQCDLNKESRSIKVLYVCYVHGKNEIYSIKETSTCNYEAIILTPSLCAHPLFKPNDVNDNQIKCFPRTEDTPKKPKDLFKLENSGSISSSSSFVDQLEGSLKMEIIESSEHLSKFLEAFKEKPEIADETPADKMDADAGVLASGSTSDAMHVQNFLAGRYCLTGGTGWWKYEFCYGRYVRQFHGTTSVYLGFFKQDVHNKWLEKHPQKRPKAVSQRKQLIHFYADGHLCEEAHRNRETEVVLKCMENARSPSAVSLYLLEPQTCQYILGVESPLICDILKQADDETGLIATGLFQEPNLVEQFTLDDVLDDAAADGERLGND